MHDSRFSRLDDLSTMIEVTEICLKAYLGLFQHHNQHRITLTFFTHGLGAVIAANTGMAIHRAVGNDVYVKYIFGEFELKQSFLRGKQILAVLLIWIWIEISMVAGVSVKTCIWVWAFRILPLPLWAMVMVLFGPLELWNIRIQWSFERSKAQSWNRIINCHC